MNCGHSLSGDGVICAYCRQHIVLAEIAADPVIQRACDMLAEYDLTGTLPPRPGEPPADDQLRLL